MLRPFIACLTLLFSFTASGESNVFPILDRLNASGITLHPETLESMKKWRSLNLEDTQTYRLGEIAGTTSVNVKIHKLDSTDPKGYKSRGSFVARNSAANPNTEIAYFNLAAIFGVDYLFRPAVRYELGPIASESFRQLLVATPVKSLKQKNKDRILAEIAKGAPLKGCLKAKKPDSARELEEIGLGSPNRNHPIIQMIQASSPQPRKGSSLQLSRRYIGDEYELAQEFSILLTFDATFGQWDRFSGGNVVMRLDATGRAHFYSTDNGGADFSSTSQRVEKTLSYFSRFDRATIESLKLLYRFLEAPQTGYLGYTDARAFVKDLGLYFELSPDTYITRLKRNIGLVLARANAAETKYGSAAYFEY